MDVTALSLPGRYLRDRVFAAARARQLRRDHGIDRSLYARRLVVDPAALTGVVRDSIRRNFSGSPWPGDWDLAPRPLSDAPKVAYCLRHWDDGLDWRAAGAVDHLMAVIARRGSVDGCRTEAQVLARLDRLDAIRDRVAAEGRLRPVAEVRRPVFRESGGVLVHVDRHGRPLFGGAGNHRLGIALSLALPEIPAQLGVVHPAALPLLDGGLTGARLA